MGKRIVEVETQEENNFGENEEREAVSEEDYELCDEVSSHRQTTFEMIKCQQNSKNKQKFESESEDEDEDEDELSSVQYKQKKKRQRRFNAEDQINCKDIIEIIIIIILVIILGISLFRVMFEVQLQYKIEEERTKGKIRYVDSELSDYEKLNRKNNPNENYAQYQKRETKKVGIESTNKFELQKKVVWAEEVKFNVSAECANYIWQELLKNGQLYDFRATYEELNMRSKTSRFKENMNTDIETEQFRRAVEMVGLIHQTDFKGVLNVKGSPCESVESKKERLQNAVNQQKDEWNKEYDMEKYFKRQMRFCLVVNSYNNARNGLIYRNTDSILQQNYTNYHVVYTDDHSKDNTGEKVKEYLQQKNVPENLFQVRMNEEQKGMMENIYTAIHEQCKDGEIVVMLDGDDSLIGTNVLALLNAVYQKEKLALMWSNFVTVFNNDQINMGFSRDYPEKNKMEGSFRKVKVFLSSHLKTFFVDVFKEINPSDLQTNDGKFYRGASDTAMMIPMIEMANPKIMYLPELLYEYRYDTGQAGNSVNRIPQKEALKKIFSSQPYKKLTDFSFIQKAIDEAIEISEDEIKQQSPAEDEIKNANISSSEAIIKI